MKLIVHNSKLGANGAAATLPVILLVGGLIVEIGIAGAFIAFFLGQSGLGVRFSEEALAVARAGIQDATMRIIRSKSLVPDSYTLIMDNRLAQITICKDKITVSSVCSTAMPGKYEITSLGTSFTKRRQIRTILQVDSYTGEVKLESEKEIAI